MDIEKIRQDFPILKRLVRGRNLVYLDNAATSQKPRQVIEALSSFYQNSNANVHRGIHTLSDEATELMESARLKISRFIHAPEASTVLFTRNTTEAINLVAYAWARRNLKPGERIVATEMEHHSNLIPWQCIARETGAELRLIPVLAEGTLDLEAAQRLIHPKTRIVVFAGMSNVLGTINPVRELVELAHRQGALALMDGAQWVPHLPTDVRNLDCDFLAFSAHKMLGPTGIGILYAKKEILENMEPFQGGGGMIQEVWPDHATWAAPPWRFEAGTPNIADAVAFGAAIDYLNQLGFSALRDQEEKLTEEALQILQADKEIRIYGPLETSRRGGVISFNLNGVHPHDLGTVLDSQGIAIRAGHHCCQVLMKKFKISATARVSFYLYNTSEEVKAFASGLRKAKELFLSPATP